MNDFQYIPIIQQQEGEVYLLRLESKRSSEGKWIASIEPIKSERFNEEHPEAEIII